MAIDKLIQVYFLIGDSISLQHLVIHASNTIPYYTKPHSLLNLLNNNNDNVNNINDNEELSELYNRKLKRIKLYKEEDNSINTITKEIEQLTWSNTATIIYDIYLTLIKSTVINLPIKLQVTATDLPQTPPVTSCQSPLNESIDDISTTTITNDVEIVDNNNNNNNKENKDNTTTVPARQSIRVREKEQREIQESPDSEFILKLSNYLLSKSIDTDSVQSPISISNNATQINNDINNNNKMIEEEVSEEIEKYYVNEWINNANENNTSLMEYITDFLHNIC